MHHCLQAIIDNIDYSVELNNTREIILRGIEVDFFEITSTMLHGSLRFINNRNILPNKTQIDTNTTIKYTPSITTTGTETISYRAYSTGGVYTTTKTITISIIEERLSIVKKQTVDNIVTSNSLLSSILSSLDNIIPPNISIGSDFFNNFNALEKSRS